MNKLEECRKRIDEIDTKIIELYEQRMDVVKEVTNYKLENGLNVLDSSREAAMLEKNTEKVQSQEYKKYYKNVLDGFLKSSKDMQHEIMNKNK